MRLPAAAVLILVLGCGACTGAPVRAPAAPPLIDTAPGLARGDVARSVEGRPIYRVHYGHGPIRVLLRSQKHGNESTATMALADIIRFLAESPEHPLGAADDYFEERLIRGDPGRTEVAGIAASGRQ